jgi:hypothetical protein
MALWIAPGLAVILVSLGLTLLHIGLGIARRPHLPLALFAIRLRQFGLGLMFLGAGASIAVTALGEGPNIFGLVIGALVAGMGGLYFIAAKALRQGTPLMDMSTKTPVRSQHVSSPKEESLESKAKRLHEIVHPEDARRSKGDDSDVG